MPGVAGIASVLLLYALLEIRTNTQAIQAKHTRLTMLEQNVQRTAEQLRASQAEARKAAAELADARERVEKLESPNPAAEAELTSWTNRVARLRKRLAERPDLSIPELRYALPKDWLDATVEPSLTSDADYRKVLSRLRLNAKARFGTKLQAAIQRYQAAAPSQPVTDLSQLAPYFDENVDPAVLKRYRPATADEVKAIGLVVQNAHWRFIEATPTDAYYDSTVVISDNGWGLRYSSFYQREVEAAVATFADEHGGARPSSPEELARYLKSPIDPEFVREQLRGGVSP